MVLFETHCHTDESSNCGKIPAAELVELFIENGYDGIVITDHFLLSGSEPISLEEYRSRATKLRLGYEAALKAAKGRIAILRGVEIRLMENDNDYLIYGVTDEFIDNNPDMRKMDIAQLSELTHRLGLPLIQAHPFRNRIVVVNPTLLDGVEAYNGNLRHDSRNDITAKWAEKFSLIKTSGSDFHEYEDLARGGVYFDREIATNDDFVSALLSNRHTLKETP